MRSCNDHVFSWPGPTVGQLPHFEGVELHHVDDVAVLTHRDVVRVLEAAGDIPGAGEAAGVHLDDVASWLFGPGIETELWAGDCVKVAS